MTGSERCGSAAPRIFPHPLSSKLQNPADVQSLTASQTRGRLAKFKLKLESGLSPGANRLCQGVLMGTPPHKDSKTKTK